MSKREKRETTKTASSSEAAEIFTAIRTELARARSSPAEGKRALARIAALLTRAETALANAHHMLGDAERELGGAAVTFALVDAADTVTEDDRSSHSLSLGQSVFALRAVRGELESVAAPTEME